MKLNLIRIACFLFLVSCTKNPVALPQNNLSNASLLDTATYTPIINYGKLNFSISGLKNNNGFVAVAIFNSQSSFNKGTEPYKIFYKKVLSSKIQLNIDSIIYGTYSISVFHDENSNKILDKNFLGIPKEGFGFSNNAKGNFGPPSFKDASFYVNKKDVSISEILLSYF